MSRGDGWRPPAIALDEPRELALGDVIGWGRAAWEVVEVQGRARWSENEADRRVTARRVYGPKSSHEDAAQLMRLVYASSEPPATYRDGRVWLCSCCQHPVPCRLEEIEQLARFELESLEAMLANALPGVCYACGEPITTRQGWQGFDGEHLDLPGFPAPVFHTRNSCREHRLAYADDVQAREQGDPYADDTSESDR